MEDRGNLFSIEDPGDIGVTNTGMISPSKNERESFELFKDSDKKKNDGKEYSFEMESLGTSRMRRSNSFASETNSDFHLQKKVDYYGHSVVLESKNFHESRKLKWQIATVYCGMLIIGLSDQTIGTLLPRFLEDYPGLDRSVVSYLFLTQFAGYMISSLLNNFFHRMFGFFGCFALSLISQMSAFALISTKPSFSLLLPCYTLIGLGIGQQDCAFSLWTGTLDYHNQILGVLHSFYGLGCMITPVLATHLIHAGMKWQYYYLILFAVAFSTMVAVLLLFRDETKWKYLYNQLEAKKKADKEFDESHSGEERSEPTTLQMLKNKQVLFFTGGLFIYVGAETAFGNWLYNYDITILKIGEKEASFMTSLFWFCMTLGRFTLAFVNGRFFENREHLCMLIYTSLVTLGNIGFTFASNNAFRTVCVCMIGYFVGPIFATIVIVALKFLPRDIYAVAMGIIAGFGGSGGAVLPYSIGWVSELGGDGKGLKFFPAMSLVYFGGAMIVWIYFYVKNGEKFRQRAMRH